MARVVESEHVAVSPWRIWLRTVAIGIGFGIVFWILALLLTRYVIEPLTCRQVVDAATCTNASSLAGNIAIILATLLSILAMIRIGVAQPIIIAVGTAALLWNLVAWTNGLFWAEALGLGVLAFAVSYALFAWITRYPRFIVSAIIGIVAVVIIRIGLLL